MSDVVCACVSVCVSHRNPKFPDVKVLQAAVLCEQVSQFACEQGGVSQPTDIPIVIGGDFNSLPCKYKPDVFDRVGPFTHIHTHTHTERERERERGRERIERERERRWTC